MKKHLISCNLAWLVAVVLLVAAPASAAVYEVGVDGTLTDLLDEVTVTLADGDAIYVPGDAGTAADVPHSFLLTRSISIFGDGPGVSVIRGVAATATRFLTVESSLRIKGVTLKGFTDAIHLDPPGGLDPDPGVVIDALEVEIKNSERGIVALWHNDENTGAIAMARIKDCRFSVLDDAAIYLQTRKIREADVTGNHIRTVGLAGIYLGDDGADEDLEAYSKNFIVSGNHVSDVAQVTAGNFTRNFGIAIFGREAVVKGNIIRDLNRGVTSLGGGDSYTGIYTKAAYVVISENICHDAGPGYCLDVKGLSREHARTDPPGYSSIIANNQIFISDHFIVDDQGPTLARKHSGIKTNAEDVTIIGNHIENASQEAILVQRKATDDVSVIGNTVILGERDSGFGYGVLVQTYLVSTPDVPTPLSPADRQIMVTNNRFVGVDPCDTVVNREYDGSSWSTANPPPTGPGEWLLGHNIPALPGSGC
ncbi:MAG: right-handed parallel beta-helix repeat-containing protein [Acidobacteriota bacterium]